MVTITGTVFHLMNSLKVMWKPFWSRMLRHRRPASDAENLSLSRVLVYDV